MPKNNLKPWSPADVRRMRSLAKRGYSARESAEQLGRSTGATKFKAMTEGIRFSAINQPQGVQRKLAKKRVRFGMRATLDTRAAA